MLFRFVYIVKFWWIKYIKVSSVDNVWIWKYNVYYFNVFGIVFLGYGSNKRWFKSDWGGY